LEGAHLVIIPEYRRGEHDGLVGGRRQGLLDKRRSSSVDSAAMVLVAMVVVNYCMHSRLVYAGVLHTLFLLLLSGGLRVVLLFAVVLTTDPEGE
jgi:hypothetical protein